MERGGRGERGGGERDLGEARRLALDNLRSSLPLITRMTMSSSEGEKERERGGGERGEVCRALCQEDDCMCAFCEEDR